MGGHEGFFAEVVDAGFEGLEADFEVGAGRRADEDELGFGGFLPFFEPGVGFAKAERFRHGLAGCGDWDRQRRRRPEGEYDQQRRRRQDELA